MVVMETELVERGRVRGHHCRAGDWHQGGNAPFNYQTPSFTEILTGSHFVLKCT